MSFLASLSFADLQRLRGVVRKTAMQHFAPEFVTDRECDRVIEAIGPVILEQRVKMLVDAGSESAKSAVVGHRVKLLGGTSHGR